MAIPATRRINLASKHPAKGTPSITVAFLQYRVDLAVRRIRLSQYGWLFLVIVLLVGMSNPLPAHAQSQEGVPPSRLAHLKRGVNISRWFWLVPPDQETPDHFDHYLGSADLTLIRDLGFQFVRLAIAPGYLYDPDQPGILKTPILPYIDHAIARLLAYGLAVIIDIHNNLAPDSRLLGLETNPHAAADFSAFWSALARHFSVFDPEEVFFEIVNEPQFVTDPERWVSMQVQVASAIRAAAPRHTIIASGPQWSGIGGLLPMKPLNDPNVIYTFHFYEPMVFTHQGADWVFTGFEALKGVPYPVDATICAASLIALTNWLAKGFLAYYCHDGQWDASRISSRIALVADWSRRHQVPVLLGEFGVYPRYASAAARLRWLSDTRKAVESDGIGWALWAYDDSFGLARTLKRGAIAIDQAAATVLGLHYVPDLSGDLF